MASAEEVDRCPDWLSFIHGLLASLDIKEVKRKHDETSLGIRKGCGALLVKSYGVGHT